MLETYVFATFAGLGYVLHGHARHQGPFAFHQGSTRARSPDRQDYDSSSAAVPHARAYFRLPSAASESAAVAVPRGGGGGGAPRRCPAAAAAVPRGGGGGGDGSH